MELEFLASSTKERVEFVKVAGFDAVGLHLQKDEELDWPLAPDATKRHNSMGRLKAVWMIFAMCFLKIYVVKCHSVRSFSKIGSADILGH